MLINMTNLRTWVCNTQRLLTKRKHNHNNKSIHRNKYKIRSIFFITYFHYTITFTIRYCDVLLTALNISDQYIWVYKNTLISKQYNMQVHCRLTTDPKQIQNYSVTKNRTKISPQCINNSVFFQVHNQTYINLESKQTQLKDKQTRLSHTK